MLTNEELFDEVKRSLPEVCEECRGVGYHKMDCSRPRIKRGSPPMFEGAGEAGRIIDETRSDQ